MEDSRIRLTSLASVGAARTQGLPKRLNACSTIFERVAYQADPALRLAAPDMLYIRHCPKAVTSRGSSAQFVSAVRQIYNAYVAVEKVIGKGMPIRFFRKSALDGKR
jgi:hypothetical protein